MEVHDKIWEEEILEIFAMPFQKYYNFFLVQTSQADDYRKITLSVDL
jgi:hypothetical protein